VSVDITFWVKYTTNSKKRRTNWD